MAKNQTRSDPVPLFLAPSTKHGEPTSQRVTSSVYNGLLGDMGSRYGYVSSRQCYFGNTAARKGFIQDSNNTIDNTSFNSMMHLTLTADHSAMTNRTAYQSANSYRSSVPANILRRGMPKDRAMEILDSVGLQPRFEMDGCFQPNWPTRFDTLLSPREFVQKFAWSPKLFNACQCPVKTCNHVSRYQEDLQAHLNADHKKDRKETPVTCPGCKKEMTLTNYLANHVKAGPRRCTQNTNNNPLIFDTHYHSVNHYEPVPEAVWAAHCEGEDCTYWTTNAAHLRNHNCGNGKRPAQKRKSSSGGNGKRSAKKSKASESSSAQECNESSVTLPETESDTKQPAIPFPPTVPNTVSQPHSATNYAEI